jgi:predicted phosphodiesterase
MQLRLDMASPLLVFGGPYSNVRALLAMRARADELGVAASQVICTGDIAAYCAEPEATIQAVRDWGCHVVAGNCEEQLAQDADNCGCGFEDGTLCSRLSQDWYTFALQRVSRESKAWMAALPPTLTFALGGVRFSVVHGGADKSNLFVFASDVSTLAEELARTDADVVIGGHAGLPFVAQQDAKLWFNPGVIGMPANDGTPEGWYGLVHVDGAALVFSTHRLRYDHAAAAAAMRSAGLAEAYATALTTGLWPSLDVLPATERAHTGRRLDEIVVRFPGRREKTPADS